MRPPAASALGALLLLSGAADAATVRTDHPRLLFGSGTGFGTTVATFTSRCNGSDPDYAHRCQYMGGGQADPGFMPSSYTDTAGMAAAYLVWGDAQRCTNAASWLLANLPADGPGAGGDAHGFIVSYANSVIFQAIVRDWCDVTLDSTTQGQLEDRIATYSAWLIANYGGNGPIAEPPDVFHDDYANVASAVAWAGLILKGSATHDADGVTALAWADSRWKTVLLPAMAYVGDWWPEGFTYVQPTLGGLGWYAAGWSTATDENIYGYAKASANDLLANYLTFFVYAQRPDTNFIYFGDTTHTKQSESLFIEPLADMLNYGTSSATGQGFVKAVTASTLATNGFCDDVPCADGWKVALFYDSSLDASATDLTTLPTARWLSQGASDVAVMRSGWGTDDTYVWMSCGDYFGAHQHDEAGSFQIFRHGMLTGTTGGYDTFDSLHFDDYYSQHSVHANTIAVYTPSESFPTSHTIASGATANVNDGGQRVLRRTDVGGIIGAYSSTDLPTYLKNKTSGPFNETGNLETFEHATCDDYVACDVTAAYDSPGYTTSGNTAKVKEVSRQLVFVRPEVIVVFDRVESLDASFQKRFLLQASGTGVVPKVTGTVFTIDNGGGRLIGQTLLPVGASVNEVDSFTVAGTAYPPDTTMLPNEPELGGSRLEVVPAVPSVRDYFLHVFDATDPSKTSLPATVSQTADTATATITDGPNRYVVSFNKTGTLGGHITVTGAMSCDEDLGGTSGSGSGSGASLGSGTRGSGDGSGRGSGQRSGTGNGSSGSAGPMGGGSGTSGGCGCREGGSASDFAIVPFTAALFWLGRRRRRHTPGQRG